MTAIEKLEISLLGIISFDSEELRAKYKEAIKQSKEMEKQQGGYSEEDMNDYANYRLLFKKPIEPKEWFEQFKNK